MRALVKALDARKPDARYVVGRQAKMGLFVLPRMPTSVRDRMLMSSMGLQRGVFTGVRALPRAGDPDTP